MAVLEHLEPRDVFSFFEQLCAIPHGSGNSRVVSDWLMEFAARRGLEARRDGCNNAVIVKPASPGYEAAGPVILQGHVDMVCEKAPGCEKDMEREGLDLVTEGDTIYARGTSLGGDDGIAVAMALAILDRKDLPHPRVEAVFTTDEEIGMLGAAGLDVSMLQGRRMLNLDSETEGVFTVSCAGGSETRCVIPVTRAPFRGEGLAITVSGLRGGHSGMEIHQGRGNANLLLGRVLRAAWERSGLRLQSVDGGLKDNAIPREATAVLAAADPQAVRDVCREMEAVLRREYQTADPDVSVRVRAAEAPLPMDDASTRRIIGFLTCVPDGVQVMSPEIPGLVQTSLNLGILKTDEREVTGASCVRSSVESQKQMLVERLRCLAELLGGRAEVYGDYTGWAYRKDSPLRELLAEVFTQQYGHPPRIEAVHAGLECGIFAGKLPGLDCVSLGPDLREIHTCQEKMHIASVQRLWALLVETLRRMK